jgi:L-iditol 2-dehydrogenase
VKAVVKVARGPGNMMLKDVRAPRPGPGQALLRVAYAGICGTDIHILHDEFPYWPPVVLGHEFVGTVEEVAADVDPAWVGRRVVCEPHAGACGTCYLCRRGYAQLCSQKRSPGWGVDGAFASHLVVPASLLHRVPDDLPDLAAVLCEPTAIGLSALERAPVVPGDTVVVTGPGPVGILAAMAARFAGAARVVVLGQRDVDRERLAAAGRLGFDAVGTPEDAREAVLEATDGRGADLLIEASGAQLAIGAGIELLRSRARVAAIGMSGRSSIEFAWDAAMQKALDVAFSLSSSHTVWDPALVLLERNAADAASLVTAFSLDRWADAFAAAESRTVIKPALQP